ncbi:alpha/beta hydrolase family esterase [Bordetella flabilis]|uniref:Esterase n=1 Tax=Bordetella flabilis TaxID=463014 RepID=A0A193GE78_9BORD|nr:PHB depolymerase family esterase [Bordetella flabilis]ANN77923.1 esterase [Bordetella flabilis]
MNDLFRQQMAAATALTRSGRLGEATLAIQHALRSGTSTLYRPNPRATPPPAAHGGTGAPQAMVLDRLDRVIDSTDVTEVVEATDAGSPAPSTVVADAPEAERWIDGSFAHQGRKLTYKLYLPPSSAAMAPTPRPMVVMLHGCTQGAADFATGTRMHALARDLGVVVLYPEQDRRANPQKCWNWFKPQHQQRGRGEPAVLAALTQSIAAEYGVDTDRVFVAGLSAGGAMAEIVGRCYPDVFAAVGVHSGLPAGSATDVMTALAAMRGASAAPTKRQIDAAVPPTIVFHGDADTVVHVNNGAAIVEAARKANGTEAAGPGPASQGEGQSSRGQRYTRRVYNDAEGRGKTEYWLLHGAGHAWSGGDAQGSYTDPAGVDASAEMLRFFLAHPRRR